LNPPGEAYPPAEVFELARRWGWQRAGPVSSMPVTPLVSAQTWLENPGNIPRKFTAGKIIYKWWRVRFNGDFLEFILILWDVKM
jgi:hypothetical protein